MVRLVEAALLELWQDLRQGSAQEAAAVKRRISELEQRKKRLVQRLDSFRRQAVAA